MKIGIFIITTTLLLDAQLIVIILHLSYTLNILTILTILCLN